DNAMLMLAMFHPAITLQISSGGAFYRKASADALDARPEGRQLLLQRFVAAVEVVDAVDQGLAFGDEAGYDQPRRGAQVGGHDGPRARLTQLFQRSVERFGCRAHQAHAAAGGGGRGEVGTGLYAIGHHLMLGAAERCHALDADEVAARAFDPRAHRAEAAREI